MSVRELEKVGAGVMGLAGIRRLAGIGGLTCHTLKILGRSKSESSTDTHFEVGPADRQGRELAATPSVTPSGRRGNPSIRGNENDPGVTRRPRWGRFRSRTRRFSPVLFLSVSCSRLFSPGRLSRFSSLCFSSLRFSSILFFSLRPSVSPSLRCIVSAIHSFQTAEAPIAAAGRLPQLTCPLPPSWPFPLAWETFLRGP